MSESREEAGEPLPLPQLQESEKSLKELRPLKGAKSVMWLHFGLCVVDAKLVNNNTRKSNVGTVELLWSTYTVVPLLTWRRTRPSGTKAWRLNRQQKSCTTKQASLGGFGIRVVSAWSCRSSKSYNIVNRYIIVKEKCYNIVTENFGDVQPLSCSTCTALWIQPGAVKLDLWRHWCMQIRCIQWPRRTNFTTPGCIWMMSSHFFLYLDDVISFL